MSYNMLCTLLTNFFYQWYFIEIWSSYPWLMYSEGQQGKAIFLVFWFWRVTNKILIKTLFSFFFFWDCSLIKKKIVGETRKIFNILERFLKGISYSSSQKKKKKWNSGVLLKQKNRRKRSRRWYKHVRNDEKQKVL